MVERIIGSNVRFSCYLLDVIHKVILWIGEQSPNVAGYALKGPFKALRPVLLSHVGLAFDDSDVDRFLAFCH